jgi:hypothetical protein
MGCITHSYQHPVAMHYAQLPPMGKVWLPAVTTVARWVAGSGLARVSRCACAVRCRRVTLATTPVGWVPMALGLSVRALPAHAPGRTRDRVGRQEGRYLAGGTVPTGGGAGVPGEAPVARSAWPGTAVAVLCAREVQKNACMQIAYHLSPAHNPAVPLDCRPDHPRIANRLTL